MPAVFCVSAYISSRAGVVAQNGQFKIINIVNKKYFLTLYK